VIAFPSITDRGFFEQDLIDDFVAAGNLYRSIAARNAGDNWGCFLGCTIEKLAISPIPGRVPATDCAVGGEVGALIGNWMTDPRSQTAGGTSPVYDFAWAIENSLFARNTVIPEPIGIP